MHNEVDKLPIDCAKQEILTAIGEEDVTIITSEKGSGKSTRVPQFVLDEHLHQGMSCRIVVTEQRRVAAIEIAKRVASERGERLSETGRASVGYAVKEDILLPYSWNNIVYATEE